MATASITRAAAAVGGVNLLVSGAVYYNTNTKLERNHEEAEARMDELEGTLRGHIGLIEESLERLEGKQEDGGKSGWGKGMGGKSEELYQGRGKHEKES